MTTEVQYDFTAPITAKGKQRSGDGWTLTFDWKMPGSKFDLVLYGQDWEQVSAWDINTVPDVSIQRGNLKNGKSGQYNTDYFWDLAGISQGNGQRTAPPATDRPQQASMTDAQPKPDLDKRIAWNSAVNNAVHLHGPTDWASILDGTAQFNWGWIRNTANDIYDLITAGPPQETAPGGAEADAQEPYVPSRTPNPANQVSVAVADWNNRNPTAKVTQASLTNDIYRIYGIGEPTLEESMTALGPERALELSTAISNGNVQDLIDRAMKAEADELPF